MDEMENKLPEEVEKPTQQTNMMPENQEINDIINRFSEGQDLSTPEGIMAGALSVLKKMVPIYDKLWDLANTSDDVAAFIKDLLDTGDVLKSLARNYDASELEAAIEAVKSEDYDEDVKGYQGKVQSKKDRMAELEANRAQSQQSAQEFMDKIQPSDEDIDGFIAFYDSFLKDAVDNKMSLDHWQAIWNAYKHDDDVNEAQETGVIIGKNQKIVAQKATKEDEKKVLPEGSVGASVLPKEKPQSFGAKFLKGAI